MDKKITPYQHRKVGSLYKVKINHMDLIHVSMISNILFIIKNNQKIIGILAKSKGDI
jgi:hypothetical protein